MTSVARKISDAMLKRYLADELDAKEKTLIETALAASPGYQARLKKLQKYSMPIEPMQATGHSLGGIYERFAPAIYRRIRSLLRDSEEAYEIVQDIFVAYLASHGSAGSRGSPFAELYQLATYKAMARLRLRSRQSKVLLSFAKADEEQKESLSSWREGPDFGDGGLDRVEARYDLAQLTEGESPQVLTAAVLYFVEGYTTEEVAKVLDLDRRGTSQMLRQFAKRARQRQSTLQESVLARPLSVRRIPDEKLEAYLEGELDAQARAQVEAALADSPLDQRRLEALHAEAAAFLLKHPPKALFERLQEERQRSVTPEENRSLLQKLAPVLVHIAHSHPEPSIMAGGSAIIDALFQHPGTEFLILHPPDSEVMRTVRVSALLDIWFAPMERGAHGLPRVLVAHLAQHLGMRGSDVQTSDTWERSGWTQNLRVSFVPLPEVSGRKLWAWVFQEVALVRAAG
jgi:RNA polymerase sigma-70 factor (ECF subfamily)